MTHLRRILAQSTACFVLLMLTVVNPDISLAATAQPAQRSKAQNLPDFVELTKRLAPIVVNISTTVSSPQGQGTPDPFGGNDPFDEFWRRYFGNPPGTPRGPLPPQRNLGSGFIIDGKGFIVTNNHVVENAKKITVKLSDEREFEAKIVGRDPKTDIAVVQIADGKGNFPAAPLGDSNRLEVGEWVLAMGSPFGLDNSVTVGIVSAKGRHIGAGPYDNFIQTDASINPGNSGGPLINLRGEVVGINTAIFSRTGGNLGIGFAIPVELVKEILPALIEKGKVTRGYLGVTIQRITPAIAESLGLENSRGALVANVAQGSPGAEAGIKPGDVILEYEGNKIEDPNQLPILVARTEVGKSVKLVILRDKKQIPITLKVGELKEQEVVASAPQKEKLGLILQNVTPQIAESLGLDQSEGVVITSVEPQSPASEAGLRPGDVILEVNRKRIRNLEDYRNVIGEAKPGRNMLLLVRRAGNNLFLALKPPGSQG